MREARIVVLLLITVLVAACGDIPTAPGAQADDASRSSSYLLPPVIVVGTPQCNPYTDLNWCQGDGSGGGSTCMTSAPGGEIDPEYLVTSTCPGAGTGGGKPGGGGGASEPGAETSGGSTKSSTDDVSGCPECGERQPTPEEKAAMETQLANVTCADGKQALMAAFAAQRVLIYTLDDGRYGSYDSDTGLTYVSRPRHWLTAGLDAHELGDTLVHEVVHKLLGHTNGQPTHETHGADFETKMASCGFPQP